MRPKASSLASTQLAVFGGEGMLPMIPRTPSPLSNMEVETLYFGGVFSAKGTGQLHCIKGDDGDGWGHVPPGHWKCVVDGYSSMTMNQNTRPRQQRGGSRSTFWSWSGLASHPIENLWRELKVWVSKVSLETLMTWRGSAKRSETKSLLRCVQTWWPTTTKTSDLCDC